MRTTLVLSIALLAACSPEPIEDEDPVDLSEAVTIDALMGHLEALSAIGDDRLGTRVSGSDGYAASVSYVTDALEAAGFEVTLDEYPISGFRLLDASLVVGEVAFTLGDDGDEGFQVFPMSGAGDLSGSAVPVDLHLPAGEQNSSTSGCETADFEGFPSGSVALIQRGSCTFLSKVENAVAAGATAVLIFNEGQEGRTEPVSGSLGDDQAAVPVIGLSYAAGEALAEASSRDVTLAVDASAAASVEDNVIVELPGLDPSRVVMVGAHLDSVQAGPGINDNGSGSALVLELALQAAASGWTPRNTVRFAWWGAEEEGLVGSWHWANDEETGDPDWERLDPLVAYINYDMVASGNGYRFVYDGEDPRYGSDPSAAIEAIYRDFFDARGQEVAQTDLLIPTDSYWFVGAGVPVGGLYSGAFETMSEAWAAEVGGEVGEDLDPCYHRACDLVENTDEVLYAELAAAGSHVVQVLGDLTGDLGGDLGTSTQRRVVADLPRPRGCHDHVIWDR